MALNISDKKSLADQMLPTIYFSISSTGITINCERLNTVRFVSFDGKGGKCKTCRSDNVEIDYVVTKDGVTLFCNRIKGEKFIAFDFIYALPEHCVFRLRSKGKTFNIPYDHGEYSNTTAVDQPAEVQQQQQQSTQDEKDFKQKWDELMEELNAVRSIMPNDMPKKN